MNYLKITQLALTDYERDERDEKGPERPVPRPTAISPPSTNEKVRARLHVDRNVVEKDCTAIRQGRNAPRGVRLAASMPSAGTVFSIADRRFLLPRCTVKSFEQSGVDALREPLALSHQLVCIQGSGRCYINRWARPQLR